MKKLVAVTVAVLAIGTPAAQASDATLKTTIVKTADYFRATTKGDATIQRSARAFATMTAFRARLRAEKPSSARGQQAKVLAIRGATYMIAAFDLEVSGLRKLENLETFEEATFDLERAFIRAETGASFLCSAGRTIGVRLRLGSEFPCGSS